MMNDLLVQLSDKGAVSELLQSNKEFLMEQLKNVDVVLELDIIFMPNMSKEERFRWYHKVIDERIKESRVPAAKKVLGALRGFVMSRQ